MRKTHLLRSSLVILVVLLNGFGCGSDTGPDGRKDGKSYPDLFPVQRDQAGGCSSAICMGCCQNGQCQQGTSTSACGYGGLACRTCGSGEQCKDGVCDTTPACDSTSCKTGCCDNTGKCQTGGSSDACGTGAAACKTCDANSMCSQGNCVAKAADSYRVFLVSAVVKNPSDACDFMGVSDPCDVYVTLTVGGVQKESAVISNNNSPDWTVKYPPDGQEMMTASKSDLLAGMHVLLEDDDVTWDPNLGECTFTVTDAILAAGKATQACGQYISAVTFAFKPAN